MRTKAPRADRLDKVRDIAVILHRNGGKMAKGDLAQQIKEIVSPPQIDFWTMSNIKEYVASLLFLKLAISPRRPVIYLTNTGEILASKGSFGATELNEEEKEVLKGAIFHNIRFQLFLALFTGGKIPKDITEFVAIGKNIKLKQDQLRTELDRREVHDIFKSWALSTELIEWNSTSNEYFPVMYQKISLEQMLSTLLEIYDKVEDNTIKRAEIYKIKDIICQKYRIARRQFYDNLIEISKKYTDRIRLEVVPITMMPIQEFKIEAAKHFGIVTSKGIYYYIKILN